MNRLKKIRNENSLTLMDLSKKLDIPKSTLSRYENGTSEPKQETWEQIADFFKVPVFYLRGITEEEVNEVKNIIQSYKLDNEKRIDKKLAALIDSESSEDQKLLLDHFIDFYFGFSSINDGAFQKDFAIIFNQINKLNISMEENNQDELKKHELKQLYIEDLKNITDKLFDDLNNYYN
ncbi:helix-turn-helix transcriptional regulator [Vagococcus carniphilus]|uniref:helix-turn-helix domain-containing protein n=1 Tax=Vagococcus carniphilus TaxID=218144 RepID=UPI00288F7BCF|nr:helix-turn-helix transcriptional regulator [Vagococcus carniphilus]MDT2831874.1 helix-turn-helix transcriptional regulator [Vagococcus carniphilus]MDT2855384.1 helix-turn-helix transcriptional regulator [Vagococcus carniphilus]